MSRGEAAWVRHEGHGLDLEHYVLHLPLEDHETAIEALDSFPVVSILPRPEREWRTRAKREAGTP